MLLALLLFLKPVSAFSHHRTSSPIQHLVVVVLENHTFENFFGTWCQAPTGSNPSCTSGPGCCEAGPAAVSGKKPTVLDDAENGARDPDHSQRCELDEMDNGRMDRYVSGSLLCSDERNFSYAPAKLVQPFIDWARSYAIADRYFQPIAGASSSNDMYLARAGYVFTDNSLEPDAIGSQCGDVNPDRKILTDPTVGDLLAESAVSWKFYAEGYSAMKKAVAAGACPAPLAGCPAGSTAYPCVYDPSDDPFAYYVPFVDNPIYMADTDALAADVAHGTLPSVSWAKPIGFRTGHPGDGTTLSASVAYAKSVVDLIEGSAYADDTLVLVTTDESGGYFDHVAPPPASSVDGQPYGPRIPLIAVGRFARPGFVSHVTMEHSSIVKFIEWNWLGGKTGQLGTRDAEVAGLGSLLTVGGP